MSGLVSWRWYEKLAMEADIDYKLPDNLFQQSAFLPCKLYKVCMKHKNIFSYHIIMN
jgi:hypothetical protein